MKISRKVSSLLLSLCIFSCLFVNAYAADIDSSDTLVPEVENAISDANENTQNVNSSDALVPEVENITSEANKNNQDIEPRADEFWSVTSNNVNIRSGPGTSYSSYGYLQSGQIVLWGAYDQVQNPDVYDNGYYWKKVMVYDGPHDGLEGWVSTNNLRFIR